jgi:adenine-specific DNA methylase
MNQKKKLIEVALPLEAINTASAREKSIRHGHPSTLHLYVRIPKRSPQRPGFGIWM